MKRLPAAICAVLLAACAAIPAESLAEDDHAHGAAVPVEGEAAILLTGLDGDVLTLTAGDLAALPQVSLEATIHGETHLYEGPLLADLLARTGAPLGPDMHGAALMQVVVVSARDGYRVVFSLAEVDPGLSPNRVMLATRMDGAPLGEADGPFRLIVENALRGARSARMVSSVGIRAVE